MAFRYTGVNWEGRFWRTVGAITTLGQQIEQLRPGSYPVDGTVASKAHDVVSPNSDHRPDWDVPGNVRAIDFGGPAGFIDDTVEAIRVSRDPRVRYVIHDRRMFSSYPKPGYPPFTWRPYTGPAPHSSHAHVSVVDDVRGESTVPWDLEDDVPQFTEEEAEQLRKLVAGLESKDSSGWGFATQGVDLIRRERQLPLHEPETSGGDVLKRGDIVQLGNPASD
jgi:hypothetical protein